MRAEQALMLGVVALGLYAVYRMTKAPAATGVDASAPMGSTTPAPGSDLSLPEHPPDVPPVLAGLAELGDPMALKEAGYVRVRLETAGQNAPFSVDAPREALEAAAVAMGFGPATEVHAAMNVADARTMGFPEWSLATPGVGTRWLYARWARPNQPIPKPPAWARVWASRSPNAPAPA